MKAKNHISLRPNFKAISFLLGILFFSSISTTLFSQTTTVQKATFSINNQSIFGPGSATSFNMRYNLFKDNNIETGMFTSGGVNGVLTLDQTATDIINTAIDVVNGAISLANIPEGPDIPLAIKRTSYQFGGSFNIKAGLDFDVYTDILVQGAAANITYPVNFSIRKPNDLSFGCGDSFYININAERASTGSNLSIIDPLFEFKLGTSIKAGIYSNASICFGGCNGLGGYFDYGNPSFASANSSNYKNYLKGGDYDLFKLSSSTGISFPWDLYPTLISKPSDVPSLTLPLSTSSIKDIDFKGLTNIEAIIDNPFTKLNGANTFSGLSILNSSLTNFFEIKFDPIQYSKYLTGIPLEVSANFGDNVSANFTVLSVPLTLTAKQQNNFIVSANNFFVDLNLGQTLQWVEKKITKTPIGYESKINGFGLPELVPIIKIDTIPVRNGNSNMISNFKVGNLLQILNYPGNSLTSITPIYKIDASFLSELKEIFELSVELKLAQGEFNFPAFNLSSILNRLVNELNIDPGFRKLFIDEVNKLSSISSSGKISFGPFPQPTPRLTLANFEIPVLDTNFPLSMNAVNGSTFNLQPDNVPPNVVAINNKNFFMQNDSLIITPQELVRQATDAHGGTIEYISLVPNKFTCSDIGMTIPVQLTVGDNRCNQVTNNINVRIYDNIGPTARCKTTPITVYLNSSGVTRTLNVSEIDNNSTGNCLTEKYLTLSQFNCNHKGNNVIGLVLKDKNFTSNCTATVVVVDTIRPIAVCKAKVTDIVLSAAGTANVSVSMLDSSLTRDNCTTSLTKSVFPSPLKCNNKGLNTITYTVTDQSNNRNSCTGRVNVIDNTTPTFTCPTNMTVAACTPVKVLYPNPQITDNCSPVLKINQIGGLKSDTIFPMGKTTNSFQLKDNLGNVLGNCNFSVTLQNSGPPQIICPPNTTLNTNVDDICTNSFAPFGPIATSPCGYSLTLSLVSGILPGNPIPFGTTQSIYKVTDQNGNTATCSFTYTVVDPYKPEIVCPQNIVVDANPGACSKVVAYSDPTGSDNCFGSSGLTFTRIAGLASGSVFPKGTSTISYELSDYSENKDTCSFTVTVNDINSPPSISCPSNLSIHTTASSCDAIVEFTTPVGTDNCSDSVTEQVSGLESGSSFPQGITNNIFVVTDNNGSSASCSFTVSVIDNQAPQIICPQSLVVNCKSESSTNNRKVNYELPDAFDNCNATITRIVGPSSGEEFPEGITEIIFKATDQSGLLSTCSFTVELNDCNSAPIAKCKSKLVDVGSSCNIDISTTDIDSNSIDPDNDVLSMNILPSGPYGLGNHILSLQVSDPSGLSDQCTFILNVIDQTPPVAPTLPKVNLGQCAGTPLPPKVLDNCDGEIIGITSTNFPIEDQGITFVTWAFTDASGNSSTAIQEFEVKDTEDPIAPILADLNIGECSGIPPTPSAVDNCSGIIEGVSNVEFPITAQGTTIVTWSFTDANGNTTNATQNIILQDNIAPRVPVIADLELELTSYTPSLPIAKDNCSGDVIGTTTTTFPITMQGTTTVIWYFEDDYGNISSTTQKITLDDITPPEVPTLLDVNLGECSGTPQIPTTNDNVTGVIEGTTTTLFPITKQGLTVVNWIFDDGNGNSITVPQNFFIDDITSPVVPDLEDVAILACQTILSPPIAIDNCTGEIIGTANIEFPIRVPGLHTVTWKFDDGNGNISEADQQVFVEIPNVPGQYLNLESCIMTLCPPGTYCPGRTTEPIPCKAGSYSQVSGSAICLTCPAGTYQGDEGQTSCMNCPPGKYSSQTGSVDCESCPAGTYQGNEGQTTCMNCPPGKYSSQTGSVVCETCPAGTYQGNEGQTSCSNCPPGKYSSQTGSVVCESCPAGTYQGDEGKDHCKLCEEGKYSDNVGATECKDCPKGSFSNVKGSIECKNCPPGKFQNEKGQTTCANCPTQTYNPYHGAYECLDCPEFTYNPNEGAIVCPNCILTITCKSLAPVNTDHGLCYASSVNLLSPTITNSCPIIRMDNDGPTKFPLGTTIVTWTVEDISGVIASCSQTVLVNKNGDPNLLFAYTIISNDDVKMKENIVESGGIGVITTNKKVSLEKNSKVTAINTFIRSGNIDVKSGSEVSTQINSLVPSSIKPVFIENVNPASNNIKINDNSAPQTLSLSNYGTIEIGKNVEVTFSGNAQVFIKDLKLKEGSKIKFDQPTQIMIDKKLDGDYFVKINENAMPGVQFYVEEEVRFNKSSIVKANIYTKKELKIESSTAGSRTYMTGQFIADKVDAKDYVSWNWDPSYCPQPIYSVSVKNNIENQKIEITSFDERNLQLYPNPTQNTVYVRLADQKNAKIEVSIFNNMGQELNIRNIELDSSNDEIIPIDVHNFPNGVYYIQVKIHGKEIMKKFAILK